MISLLRAWVCTCVCACARACLHDAPLLETQTWQDKLAGLPRCKVSPTLGQGPEAITVCGVLLRALAARCLVACASHTDGKRTPAHACMHARCEGFIWVDGRGGHSILSPPPLMGVARCLCFSHADRKEYLSTVRGYRKGSCMPLPVLCRATASQKLNSPV